MSSFGPQQEGITLRVNFNGTGTVSVRSSFNTSSITDHGTGDYTINFSNSQSNANYMSQCNAGVNNVISAICRLVTIVTGSVRFNMGEVGHARTDSNYVMIVCAGNT